MTVKSQFQFFSLLVLASASSGALAGIQFVPLYNDGAGVGFNDAAVGAQRKAAFERALTTWSNTLGTAFEGEEIRVHAQFYSFGGTATSATLAGTLASGYTARSYGSSIGTYTLAVPKALADHSVFQSNGGLGSDLQVYFNSDVDGPVVLGSAGFHYGTSTSTGGNLDFESVALHEIGHGLGFDSSLQPTTGGYALFPDEVRNDDDIPTIFDFFLGTPQLGNLIALTPAQRAEAVMHNNLYWFGNNAVLANGGFLPKMYDPAVYEGGSSFSHFDESTFPNALLSPQYSGVMREVGALERGVLQDMGWTTIPEPASLGLLLAAGLLLGRRRRVYADADA